MLRPQILSRFRIRRRPSCFSYATEWLAFKGPMKQSRQNYFSSEENDALLSANESHQQRVEAARAQKLEWKQAQQQQHIPQAQLAENAPMADNPKKRLRVTSDFDELRQVAEDTKTKKDDISPSAAHAIANNLQHWCRKDPNFFHTTMESLNISSMDISKDEHPLSDLLQQYQQLYHQAVPDFRFYIDSKPESLLPVLRKLQLAGFGDVSFSKRYRQVRGHEVRKQNLERALAKQQAEIERRKDLILKSENELADLMASAQTSAEQQRSKAIRRMAERNTIPKDQDEHSTMNTIWGKLISLFSSKPTITNDLGQNPAGSYQEESFYEPFSPPSNRVQKRVRTKIQAITSLQKDLADTQNEMLKQKETLRTLRLPLPLEDYERARATIHEVKPAICGEFAKQIRDRYALLIEQYQQLDAKTDLTKPWEWFGFARLDRRKIIFHSGPTNSGKTYSALERLKEAKCGLYLGPLRLLAAEVYDGLTADGIYANLFTGQERREIPFSTHAAATVEMASMEKEYDVVVIDEIQMIADVTRGAAWTKALLGLRCKEIHVCGGSEARDIVKKLADACGDEFELKEYKRFSPLKVSSTSLADDPTQPGCYRHVKPGDCVVAFSRNDIFAIKREIEKLTNYKCCVVYGKLPPQIRSEQARRFNDPESGYDILVASDAIGMGLNLNIKRIVFNSIFKYNGENVMRLSHSEIKQISGRAGRRNSPFPHGEVTCRDPQDILYIQECLGTEIPQIEKAALLPTTSHIELFSEGLKASGVGEDAMDLHKILRQFSAMATVKGDFFLGRQTEMQSIAKILKGTPLTLKDAYSMCLSPTSQDSMVLLQNFARKLARGEVCGLPSRSVPKAAKSFDDLSYLCNIYGDADLFLWLQYKFPPGNAVEQQAALTRKESILNFINDALANTDRLKLDHDYIHTALKHRTTWEAENSSFDDASEYDSDENDDAYAAFAERRQIRQISG